MINTIISILHFGNLFNTFTVPIKFEMILYSIYSVCLISTYSVNLYQIMFFNLRVRLYGGVYNVKEFKLRFFRDKKFYIIVTAILLVSYFILDLIDIFLAKKSVDLALTMMTIVIILLYLVFMTIYCTMLILNLKKFFMNKYE